MKNKKPILSLIIILIVSLFFISFFMKNKVDKTAEIIKKDRIAENLPQGVSLIKPEKENALPQGFPEIPLNGKTILAHAYALNYDGQSQDQKIIDFTSSKSVKENYDFYKNWAEKNKWNILYQSTNNENEARLAIEQNKRPLNITIIKNSANSKISRVNMSW